MVTDLYKKLVLDDLNNSKNLSYVVPAGFLERLLVRNAKPAKLHPNPEDEFSHPSIGPNYEIIQDYVEQFQKAIAFGNPPLKERFIVEKLSAGGYLILNGHHRWFAAHKLGLKSVPIQIVNAIPKEKILSTISGSDKNMSVSFDLDEVLLTGPKALRKYCGALITYLQNAGFDVWVYTSNPYSEQFIKLLFLKQHAAVNGVINCVFKKRFQNEIKESFCKKYSVILHIDNDSILWVDTKSREYDCIEFTDGGDGWASEAISHIKELGFSGKENRK